MSTILITGANRGIGLALAQQFAARGDRVIATCRHSSEALEKTGAHIETGIDVSDTLALTALAQRLKGNHIDQLWLNAGILTRDTFGKIDDAGFAVMQKQFDVNALGPLRTTQALYNLLGHGTKIAIITSRMGSMADNASGKNYGYRASKAAVNAIGKSLAIDLAPQGIGVFLLHPGYVATDMVDRKGDVSPEHSASQLISLVDGLDIEQTGSFWHANGSPLPW